MKNVHILIETFKYAMIELEHIQIGIYQFDLNR